MDSFDLPEYSPPSYDEANKGFDYSNEHNQTGSPQIQVQTNFTYDNPVSNQHYHQHHHHNNNSSSNNRHTIPPPSRNADSTSQNNEESSAPHGTPFGMSCFLCTLFLFFIFGVLFIILYS